MKTSWRCLKGEYFVLIRTSWKRLEDVFWRRMTKVNIFALIKTYWRCLKDIFWRRRRKTSSSRWMFPGGRYLSIIFTSMFRKVFERYYNLLFLYSTCSKKYCWLGSHWVVFIKTFHAALILASWDLILCSIIGNHLNFSKYWFHAKHSFKRSVETSFK